MPEILLRGVSKGFRGAPGVLVRVGLEIESAQVFALLGPNGAGKTTLAKILCTLLLPDEGEVRVGGFDALRHPPEVRRRLGVALDADRSFFLRLSGLENLRFFAVLQGIDYGASGRRAAAALEAVGLGPAGKRRVMEYSSGMKQKLSLARALLADPPVLVLDEPTRGLDPVATEELRAQLRALARQGKTILLVTHSLEEAAEIGDRAAILAGGRLEILGGDWRSGLGAEYRRLAGAELAGRPLVKRRPWPGWRRP